MYTEEEAKTKWCPMVRMARVVAEDGGGVPKVAATSNRGAFCIASDCMMWRWDNGSGYEHADGSKTDPERGYCGLAGRYE